MAAACCTAALELWRLAWPAMLRNTLNCASDRATLSLVGHYDGNRVHYDGAGLGKMFSNITGLSIGYGLCLGLSTLCSQAYGAGRSKHVNGLLLRRCCFILCIAFVFSAAAAFTCERALRALGQPAAVAASSARYAQVQLIGVPFFWLANALQTVCDSLQDTRPGLVSNALSAVAQVGLCVVAMHPDLLDWGYIGMAASRSAGGVVQVPHPMTLTLTSTLTGATSAWPPLGRRRRAGTSPRGPLIPSPWPSRPITLTLSSSHPDPTLALTLSLSLCWWPRAARRDRAPHSDPRPPGRGLAHGTRRRS